MRIVKWTLSVLGTLVVLLVLGLVVVPAVTASWHRRWGATSAEVAETLPGDEQIPDTTARATRAVTIDAPPERVWPWIVQEGMGRAGWYTYDAFYTLTGSAGFVDGHSSDRIVPELQGIEVGGPPSFWSSGPFEFGGFVMSRANLLGIKARAEKR
jgi:hypothetical protein